VTSTAPVAIYAGGVGAGKTIANVVSMISLALKYPGIDILACAPTYAMLFDTIIREFKQRCPEQLLSDFRSGTYPEATFQINKGRNSTVRFRSFDDPGKPKGITIGALFVDEVTEMKEDILEETMRRVRQQGMPNYIRFTTNPDSKLHPFYIRFIDPLLKGQLTSADVHYIATTSFDNYTLPQTYLDQLKRLKTVRPGHYMRAVMGEWGDFDDGSIGAFEECEGFSTPYRVAFIDSSFSDRRASDRTAVSIVAFVPLEGRENRYWPIEFTGMSWERSVTDAQVVQELLLFLDSHKPVETCFESQLGDSTKVFIDRFKEVERALGLDVKNHWTVFHQTKNKHERIMLDVAGNKDRMKVLKGTPAQYLNPLVGYTKGAAHEDEVDSLAGAINQWRTSKALAQFIRRMETK